MSARQRRKGVSALITWNSTVPMGVRTMIELMELDEPILN